MIDIRRLGPAAMFLILLAAGPARAAPEVGWWWNPNESGRGYFVESQNGIIYLAGYFYEPDGRATWLVSGGPNAEPYNYQGRLLAYSNGQTLVGDYKPPSPPTDAGPVSISFSDDTHGTIVWPGGTIPIVRQVFGSGETEFESHNGWWWNDTESGRGYSVERQGDKLFIVGFMYDGAGKPVWYYSAGAMTSPMSYSGPWLQFSGGQTLLGPYQPPAAPVVAGQLSLEFTANNEASVEIDSGQSATGSAPSSNLKINSKQFTIKPQFTSARIPIPKTFTGGLIYDWEYTSKSNGLVITTKARWKISDVVLRRSENGSAPTPFPVDKPNGPWYKLFLASGKVTVDVEQIFETPDAKCSVPSKQIKFEIDPIGFKLYVNDHGQYFGTVEHPAIGIDLLLNCVDGRGRSAPPLPFIAVTSVTEFSLGTGTFRRASEPGSTIISGQQAPEIRPYEGPKGVGTLLTSGVWSFLAVK